MPTTLDLMEYANDAAAQAAYVTSDGEVIEENFEAGGDDKSALGNDATGEKRWLTVRFITDAAIFCSSASIYLEGVTGAPTGDMTFCIETDDANEPSGTLAHANATGTIANGSIATPAWNKLSFTPFSLAAGTYWLIASIPDQANNNFWHWTRDNDGVGWYGQSGDDGVSWTVFEHFVHYFRIYAVHLQCYSEDTIVEQGTYSLKGLAQETDSLNDTLTRTIGTPIDIKDRDRIKFWIRASRTGGNIKATIRDSGTNTQDYTPNIADANTWQEEKWYIGNPKVVNADKDAIDRIIFTIINADADNTFYIDDMRAYGLAKAIML